MTHTCVSKLTIIASDNGLSPGRRQAIIWTNAGILLIGTLGTNFSEIWIAIHTVSFKKMHLKMASGKWRPFCLGLNHGHHCANKYTNNWGFWPSVEFLWFSRVRICFRWPNDIIQNCWWHTARFRGTVHVVGVKMRALSFAIRFLNWYYRYRCLTSWHWSVIHTTGTLCVESIGDLWIQYTNG